MGLFRDFHRSRVRVSGDAVRGHFDDACIFSVQKSLGTKSFSHTQHKHKTHTHRT